MGTAALSAERSDGFASEFSAQTGELTLDLGIGHAAGAGPPRGSAHPLDLLGRSVRCLPEIGDESIVGGALTALEARGLPRRHVVVDPDDALAVGCALHGAAWLLTTARNARRHGLAWTPFEGEPIRHRLALRWASTPGAARVATGAVGADVAAALPLLLGLGSRDLHTPDAPERETRGQEAPEADGATRGRPTPEREKAEGHEARGRQPERRHGPPALPRDWGLFPR